MKTLQMICAAVCVMMLGICSAQADELRTFGFLSPVVADDCPDWEAANSVSLVAHPASTRFPGSEFFRTDENYPLVSGTLWIRGDATHVTLGGKDKTAGYYVWLSNGDGPLAEDLPPNGAVAKCGPEGDVVVLARYFVREVTDSGGSASGWQVIGVDSGQAPPLGTEARFCVAMGLFSK